MKHKEAFKIMSYRCECGSQEKLWNSRDGVTPFTIPCGQCGNGMGMVHVDWDHDVFAPFLNPPAGSRYFADMTIERARQYAVRNVDSLISMGRVEETRRNELIRSLTQNYFGDGHAPDILVAQVGQDAKPAKCDGNHGGPRCADPECWADEAQKGGAT